MESFDVVVVGGRCAGASLATMLARRDIRVCVVDKARFPSETPSTHMIQPCGVRLLDELGVLDTVFAAGAVPLRDFTIVSDDVRMDATVNDVAEHPVLCVRRVTLDALLVAVAEAAGAQVRTGLRVTGLVRDDGGVTGVHTPAGPIHARLVVGADGRNSTVAAAVGAQEYHVSAPGRMAVWGYFEGGDRDGSAWLGRVKDMAYLAGPTDGDLYMAAIAPDLSRAGEFQADRDTFFSTAMRRWPELTEVIAGRQRVGPLRAFTKWHGYFRQSAGPGWVLVGDAGHFKDFTPGQGIADALRQARELAHRIEDGFASARLDDALQRWWRWRDDDAYEMYWYAARLGQSGPASPWTNRVFREISSDPVATQSFLRVLNHDMAPSKLFTPALGMRAAMRAMRDQPGHAAATVKEFFSVAGQTIRQTRRKQDRPPGMAAIAEA